MWLGELITDRGIGNGMSLLIFTSIAAVFPSARAVQLDQRRGRLRARPPARPAIVALVVFVEQAQRRIPVQYAKRMVGRRMYGGTSTYIPLKVNQAGVIPVIFASSLLYLRSCSSSSADRHDAGLQQWISTTCSRGDHPVYMFMFFAADHLLHVLLRRITFNPIEVADNMKKYGGFIPGIRPGRPTAEYLDYVLSRITAPGALYLGLIVVMPLIAFVAGRCEPELPVRRDGMLIMVGVGLETVKQIESQLKQRNYEGFLR